MKRQHNSSLTQKAMRALTEAVAEVVEDHLAVWREGKAVWIPTTGAGAFQQTQIPYRTKTHRKHP